MCIFSISRLLLPTRVVPFEAVPREMVTFSRMLLLSPISQMVSSPLNLRSCGLAGTVVDRDAVLHHVVVTQYCIFVDVAEGADDVVVA